MSSTTDIEQGVARLADAARQFALNHHITVTAVSLDNGEQYRRRAFHLLTICAGDHSVIVKLSDSEVESAGSTVTDMTGSKIQSAVDRLKLIME